MNFKEKIKVNIKVILGYKWKLYNKVDKFRSIVIT